MRRRIFHTPPSLVVALVIAASAVVSGCSPSPGRTPFATDAVRSGSHSWMSPNTSNSKLLYVSREGVNVVTILSFPTGNQVGQLSGFLAPWGLCSDPQGNVFVVDALAQDIVEFAHGGTTPIATLLDTGNAPNGCAVDPVSGNLAVAGGGPFNKIPANIAIFTAAQGTPTVYSNTQAFQYIYCTYDGSGNVFTVDVYNKPGNAVLTELPSGSSTFVKIPLQQQFRDGIHSIGWDGTYFAVMNNAGGTKGPMHVDQVQVSGSKGSIVNTIKLTDTKDIADPNGSQVWIAGSTLVYPESSQNLIGLWHYPGGAKAYKTVQSGVGEINGITVSVAP
jgi:hypothetical protein